MKKKVAIARAKQALSPEIEEHCPTELPAHLSPEEDPSGAVGWLVGQAYVKYLVADGLPEEKAKEIVSDLASSPVVSMDVIVPNEPKGSQSTDSQATAPEAKGSQSTD